MTKYTTLLNILDRIVQEAPAKFTKKYSPNLDVIDEVNLARSRAFIHLYLKVAFGLQDFEERERFVTDGGYDGGIDGYFIDIENRIVYFIQSKFRTTARNFEEKQIDLEELLVMDINRILDGETEDEKGNQYNGKILQLQRDIRDTDNIARYSYHVVILANLTGISDSQVRRLTGGFTTKFFDFEYCYRELVFPVVSGTFFTASDVHINIDLSSKDSGNRIGYSVKTKYADCEITVLFVPTIELGRIMNKYKNSILKYNPRSYLELAGQNVNKGIRNTILNEVTNEFALFNNGVTMLSDDTYFNEKIGQKGKAQLTVVNPQIINGGQTSYTLGRIYEECQNGTLDRADLVFGDKEVLLKIITLVGEEASETKEGLIEDISAATNRQTPVAAADRLSNDETHLNLQSVLFDRYGILYERKRGEFADGVYAGYLNSGDIVQRNQFLRLYFAANNELEKTVQKKVFVRYGPSKEIIENNEKLDSFYFGYLCFQKLQVLAQRWKTSELRPYAKIATMCLFFKPDRIEDFVGSVEICEELEQNWGEIINVVRSMPRYYNEISDRASGKPRLINWFEEKRWYITPTFREDIKAALVAVGMIK